MVNVHDIVRQGAKALIRTSNHRYGFTTIDVAAVTAEGSVIDLLLNFYGAEYVICIFPAKTGSPFQFGNYKPGEVVKILPVAKTNAGNSPMPMRLGVILDRDRNQYQVLVDGEMETHWWNKIMPFESEIATWAEAENIRGVESFKEIFEKTAEEQVIDEQ
jgi:hypothetical protein